MTRDEQAGVCAEFVLGHPISCNSLGGTRNHNFLLTASRGRFVVRDRYAGYRDPPRLAFDHAALGFLHARGVAVVPPMRNSSGETYWRQGERLWEVFPFAAGRQFRDADIEDVRATAAALAAFHRAGRDFKHPAPPNKLGLRGETDPVELHDLTVKMRGAAASALARYADWIGSSAAALSDQRFASLPHTLIHGDIQPANILIDGGKVSAFVDLDWCARRPRIYDLAFAILLCCATHETPIDGGDIWSLSQPPLVRSDLMEAFVQTYEQCGWLVSQEEKTALRPQVVLSWCHVRLAGAMKVDSSRRQEFLNRPPHDLTRLFPDPIT